MGKRTRYSADFKASVAIEAIRVKSHAITVLPAVSSLKVLRGYGATSGASQPIRAYADPEFSPDAGTGKSTRLASRGYGAFFRGRLADIETLSGSLPRLEETADEARAVALSLGGSDSDVVIPPEISGV